MKHMLIQLLSESGDVSMMRLLSLICVLTACFLAIYGVEHDKDLNAMAMLCSAFLGIGIGGKVMQRKVESSEKD